MLVILDRDGVINHNSEEYIKSPEEWIPIEGSLGAIARLKKAGHTVVVATNQSGIGRGYYTLDMLYQIHAKMQAMLEEEGGVIDGIYFCPHQPEDNCECRKPKPGLLLQIKDDYPGEFSQAIFVGDSERDIEAAKQAGCKAALVKTGNGEKAVKAISEREGVPIYSNLADFVKGLI